MNPSLKTTALHAEHTELKAKMAAFAGYSMPMSYQSLKEEVLTVRKSAGVFDVSHMGLIRVSGEQALEFLDYLLPNWVSQLPDQKALYSPLCNHQGQVLDDLIVYRLSAQELFICVNAANKENDFQWMQEVLAAKKFQCQMEHFFADYSLLALQGPESFAMINKIDAHLKIDDLDYYSFQKKEFMEKNCYFARTGYTGEDGFEIFIPNSLASNFWKKLVELGARPCGLAARDTLRIEVGFPLYGQEIHQDNTPLEAGLQWTVKWQKEDFIGKQALLEQEPSMKQIRLSLDKGIPRQGYAVYQNNEKIGVVTSGTFSPHLEKGIALAQIRKDINLDENNFSIELRGKFIAAQRHPKAFIQGGHK